MIRILYLIDTFFGPVGGTENQILRMIRRLDRRRFEVHLLSLQRSRWLEKAEIPCPVHTATFRSYFSLDYFRFRRQFLALCREKRFDIVQTFFRDANILGVHLGRKAGVPVLVSSRRNIGAGYWHTWFQVRLLRHLAKYTHHYIANSQAAAEEAIRVEQVPRRSVSVIPNCLDSSLYGVVDPGVRRETRAAWGIPAEALVVGAVANLRPVKNLPFLVHAARRVAERVPQAHFVVLGDGPQREALEASVRDLGLQDRFVFPGASAQVARELGAFDVSVLCSKGESSPNAVLEYMAAGRASVVPDVGGCSELIESGVHGFVYPSGNEEVFVERVVELLQDPERRRLLGERARQKVRERHDCTAVIPRLEELYETLVRDGAGTAPPQPVVSGARGPTALQ